MVGRGDVEHVILLAGRVGDALAEVGTFLDQCDTQIHRWIAQQVGRKKPRRWRRLPR